MQLAREPAPLELLRLDHAAQRVAGDAGGEIDGDGGARGERLGEAQVGLGEARVGAFLVVGDDQTDRAPAGDEGNVEAAAGAEPPGRLLVDLGVVEQRIDPLGPAPLEHPAALRPGPLELRAHDLVGAAAVGRLDPQRAVTGRQRDRHQFRPDQAAQAAGDQLEQARQLDLARERRPDLVQRLELLRPGRRRLVQARVLDRDGRLARERLDELLILGGERPAPSRSGRGSRTRGRAGGSARRGSRASADGGAGSRPTADRRRSTRAATGARR